MNRSAKLMGTFSYRSKSEQTASHPPPHIYIDHNEEKMRVHVMHHDAEPTPHPRFR
ncbi:MAG TPA: hypothetical protein VI636_17690 [Candidatus Angelobacter sp.]